MSTHSLAPAQNEKILDGLAVLIVEDEPLLLMEAEDQVRDLGCERILTASNVPSALALAQEAEFDLAMLDVNLGEFRIDSVAQKVAERGRPIVFVTGYSDTYDLPTSCAAVLAKPFSPASLRTVLKEALNGRNSL